MSILSMVSPQENLTWKISLIFAPRWIYPLEIFDLPKSHHFTAWNFCTGKIRITFGYFDRLFQWDTQKERLGLWSSILTWRALIFFFLQKIMCSCLTLTVLPNFPSFQKTWWKKKYEYVVKLFAVKWSCGKTLAAMMLADFFFNCSENFMLNTDHTKIINLCLQWNSPP